MGAKDYLKVRPGQPLRFPAGLYNGLVDLYRAWREGRLGGGTAPPAQSVVNPGVILVKNDSGSDQARLAVLGIDAPFESPADYEEGFLREVGVKCVIPYLGSHFGRFVILQEPIGADNYGRALVFGITPVKIDIENEAHQFADVDDGVTTVLASGTSGAARILWKESGTGEKWAYVALAGGLPACLTDYHVLVGDATARTYGGARVRAI